MTRAIREALTARRWSRLPVSVGVAAALALVLGGCLGSSGTTAVEAAGTALPTPSPRPPDVVGTLHHQLAVLLDARVLQVDEDLMTGQREDEVRLTTAARGSVVDATYLPIGFGSGPGFEVFRSPGALLQRPAGTGNPCWSPGGAPAARFDRPVAPELALLRSVRVSAVHDSVLTGSVSVRALLGLVGSDARLQQLGLTASAHARLPATFETADGAIQVTTSGAALAKATGATGASAMSGTWTEEFRRLDSAGPRSPTADMMCP